MKVALVSGGTKGIGHGVVDQLLADGMSVATFSRNSGQVSKLEAELSLKYDADRFLVVEGDVTKEDSVAAVVKQVKEKFGQVDILVNNAGIGYFRDVDTFDLARFEQMITTNIVGVALLTKYVVPIMKEAKTGLIINVASISGKVAFANGEFYSATKFGVMGYSQAIRAELAPFGIKVSTLCPGMIKTDFFDEEELERRKRIWNGKVPQMLEVSDITRLVSLIANQSEHSDIQDLTIMPF
ncbi:SDR family NAD(P)-dependent oxidoreductase [Candidatus Woesebacteria bacterium]|nr:SDR family NAD(P)-dependent oxidoreductase [Candidatus Woesebacteria bacterium]